MVLRDRSTNIHLNFSDQFTSTAPIDSKEGVLNDLFLRMPSMCSTPLPMNSSGFPPLSNISTNTHNWIAEIQYLHGRIKALQKGSSGFVVDLTTEDDDGDDLEADKSKASK